MQEKSFLGLGPAGFHRVAYAEWQGPSSRAPVICAHGLTRNGRDFDYLAGTLKADASVFCPDIPGRGKSDWLPASSYTYPQYLADMTALIARTGADAVDWVGTSMGGILGMLLAASNKTPIRRLVINDVGPFIPLAALKRIAAYAASAPDFAGRQELERYMREIYAPYGELSDENWRHMALHGARQLPNGQIALGHDPAIAEAFLTIEEDVDFWAAYDRIRCPVLLLRGAKSDILPASVAQEMTRRGPKARLVEFPGIGHAPALMDPAQVAVIAAFLRS